MLINKPFSRNDVVSVKLTTGEEFVARYGQQTENTLEVEKPMCIVPQQNGMGLAPFMFTTVETEYKFNMSHILAVVATHPDIAKEYQEKTSSIQLS